jgi:predicted hydrocarbon binding protein
MKGVINKGIQELVLDKFGSEAWEKIKQSAGCSEPFFAASNDYPDEMSVALIQAASQVSGLPAEVVCIEFGKYWVNHTGKDTYPSYYTMAGTNARQFLLSMGKVHEHVTRSILNASPPGLEYEELPDGKLLMHYRSSRRLCAVLRGLILGVGEHFDEKLDVKELRCFHKGADRCTMEVTFL